MMEDLGADDSLINKLPDDCLQHIFSFLDILERLEVEKVCKRWHVIGKRGWNDIKKLKIHYQYSDNIVHLILKRCGRFVRTLTIEISSKCSHCLTMIMQFCKLEQLEDIVIDFLRTRRHDEGFTRDLRKIFEKTRKLVGVSIWEFGTSYSTDCLNVLNPETLRILDFNHGDYTIDSRGRLPINPDNFPHLIGLNLEHMRIIGDDMKRERESLKGLEVLILINCDIPRNFIQRIKTFSNLQELTLGENEPDLTNQDIRDIAGHCGKITEMCIKSFTDWKTECFQYLGNMPALEILELDHFWNVSSRDFMYLVNVRHLIFHFEEEVLSGNALMELITNSSNLEKLELYFEGDVDTAFVNDFRQIFHCGQREKRLHLTIVGYTMERPRDSHEVSDHPLLTISYKS